MNEKKLLTPGYLFEVSWEVCNMVGGIHTVISTKAKTLVDELKDNYILIGPDVWKETSENPEFMEDKSIYRSWREKAEKEGLRFRVGKWKISGAPIVILVDFTPYFQQKDQIFTEFWTKYGLDSLSGQWDYIEPAMFGYAAAKIIESFYEYNLTGRDKIITQFHEWMTGSGVLYLKDRIPQAGTVFTTHATTIGRAIAGNGLPLYKKMNTYDVDEIARNFNIIAKKSLEKITAEQADSYTTVSDITSKECKAFLKKEVDLVTPNGFEDTFVPEKPKYEEKKKIAKNMLRKVAEAMTSQKLDDDTMYIATSGRYEFKNKGIDMFIDCLGQINKSGKLEKNLVAYVLIPAGHDGPKKDLLERLEKNDFNKPLTANYLTHNIYNEEHDAILSRIRENELNNSPEDKVKIIFVPMYLDGKDGVFNLKYYDLLIGLDITVFPSYYEPWGYTPLESVAFSIPTITTTLAGFGLWVKSEKNDIADGASVINRTDDNYAKACSEIAEKIIKHTLCDKKALEQAAENAYKISRLALWKNFIEKYKLTYNIALGKTAEREHLYKGKHLPEPYTAHKTFEPEKPIWKKIYIKSDVPQSLVKLRDIANNLWWAWNDEVGDVFKMINKELWEKVRYNPIAFLESLTYDQYIAIQHYEMTKNNEFINKLKLVYDKFENYLSKTKEKPKDTIAYFSMEYGLHDTIKTFSGGLGILAGDYLKQASDSNKNMVGVGILYRYGYFQQKISIKGEQIAEYQQQRFTHMPLQPVRDENNKWKIISIALPGRNLYAKIWKVEIGRIPLYLMDTDIEENQPEDRFVTHQLYGGDWENRFKQEFLLGVGGIRLLETMGIKPDLYHINEGHAAFLGLERLRHFVQMEKMEFAEALEVVRSTTLFTTHTPVPAGHDYFSENILRTYMPHYADRLRIKWNTFMNLGRFTENDPNEKFSMSVLAAKTAQEVNGVSKIHGKVTQNMFCKLWEGYFPEELYIGYVTNGVHYPSWTARKWKNLHKNEFGEQFLDDHSNPEHWKKIHDVSDLAIWDIRQNQRKELIKFVKNKLMNDFTRRQESPKTIFETLESFDENALTIGFARRFATYKRARLLFKNEERLAKIVNNADRPVQFIFAGKAHPHDQAGQDLIKHIIEISKSKKFLGKITFLENYDMEIGQKLTQGVDIWLNTPTRPLEASGTSGQKAALNGVINLSVLDGWWAEGYKPNAGWAIKEDKTYDNQETQDELDSETIYNLLEDEIIPIFYERDSKGIPVKWISYIKNTIADVAPNFTMKRMVDDYFKFYYKKLLYRSKELRKDDYQKVFEITNWKTKIMRSWENIEIVEVKLHDSRNKPLLLGEKFKAKIVINPQDINPDDIGIEVIFGKRDENKELEIIEKNEMAKEVTNGNHVTYTAEIFATRSGVFDYALRMYPKNKMLAHRQDFNLIKWI